MKKSYLAFGIALSLIAYSVWNRNVSSQSLGQPSAQQEWQSSNTAGNSQEDREHQRQNFKPARDLLEQKGVPFEAETLLDADWRDKLAPKFAQMYELKIDRRAGSRLKGVQMANILYLPEKVELTGDTVFIANQIVFEGTDAVIKGYGKNVYFYPIGKAGVLGTTLDAAMRKQQASFITASYKTARRSVKKFVPQLMSGGHITINTDGQGYEEWLEKQKRLKTQKKYEKAMFFKASSRPDQNADGGNGSAGNIGMPGPAATNGAPNPAPAGANGVCSPGSADGLEGFFGDDGGDGNMGYQGEDGGPAGSGGNIFTSITSNSYTTYTYSSKGGTGGPGGKGGPGSTGGLGATGGRGGNGADCTLKHGGTGNGGNGGDGGHGGKGGAGGVGGNGGQGGSGGNITVQYPRNFVGTIITYVGLGPGGARGAAGDAGYPGISGYGGDGGDKGNNFNCSSCPPASDGMDGQQPSNLGFGAAGTVGNIGSNGSNGHYYPVTTACVEPDDIGCDQGWIGEPSCRCRAGSPIVIDIMGDGFALTNVNDGVNFDIFSDFAPHVVAWTALGSDDAWLALDRDGNGLVDNSAELFGNFTPQPLAADPNGFAALAEYDKKANGGNGDGMITSDDTVFSRLRLWQDANHNGISEPGELHTLPELGVSMLELNYKESRRTDEYGNQFRFRARVKTRANTQSSIWAWDVFLKVK